MSTFYFDQLLLSCPNSIVMSVLNPNSHHHVLLLSHSQFSLSHLQLSASHPLDISTSALDISTSALDISPKLSGHHVPTLIIISSCYLDLNSCYLALTLWSSCPNFNHHILLLSRPHLLISHPQLLRSHSLDICHAYHL